MTRQGIDTRQGGDVKQAPSRSDESPVRAADAPTLTRTPPMPTEQLEVSQPRWLPFRGPGDVPADGTWFVARCTKPGWEATRVVHYADKSDRLPIDHSGWIWPSLPNEWMPLEDFARFEREILDTRPEGAKHTWDRFARPRSCTVCGYEEHDGSGIGYRDCSTPTASDTREWFPHLDYAGEPMQPGHFRDPPPDTPSPSASLSSEGEAVERVENLIWDAFGDSDDDRFTELAASIVAALASTTSPSDVIEKCARVAEEYPSMEAADIPVIRGIATAIRALASEKGQQ